MMLQPRLPRQRASRRTACALLFPFRPSAPPLSEVTIVAPQWHLLSAGQSRWLATTAPSLAFHQFARSGQTTLRYSTTLFSINCASRSYTCNSLANWLARSRQCPIHGPALAWLIVNAHKDIESRSWLTRFRGPVLIHGAKGMTREQYEHAFIFAINDCGLRDHFPGTLLFQRPGELRQAE